jgi:phospholipid/cholesterol/gamma-HCH transport system ATP-binding protein
MMAAVLQLEQLAVNFDGQEVLQDIDLQVPAGQRLAIIGESGCGKTVLLKTIIGLVRPSGGRVLFDGRELASLSEPELARQRMRFGFVFQQAGLFDSMTIGENVAFPLRQHDLAGEREIQQRVRETLTAVGLSEAVMDKRPGELSGGMRKRVGLARALVMQPEVFLYDEPTTGLDPIMSDVINELILQAGRLRPNVTSIVVTHDMRSARKIADRVVMLYPLSQLEPNESQILFDGPPEALEKAADQRVSQFVRGEAGARMVELVRRSV